MYEDEYIESTFFNPPTAISHFEYILITREPGDLDEVLVEFPDNQSYNLDMKNVVPYFLAIGVAQPDYAEKLLWNFNKIIIHTDNMDVEYLYADADPDARTNIFKREPISYE